MAAERLSFEHIERIKNTAKELFLEANFISIGTTNVQAVPNQKLFLSIFNLMSDNGSIYLSTADDLYDRWDELSSADEHGVTDWLIQTATNFRILAFQSDDQYDAWLSQLAAGFTQHARYTTQPNSIGAETLERLPMGNDYLDLLKYNPWFAYIVTLQLSRLDIVRAVLEMGIRLNGQLDPKTLGPAETPNE